MNWEAIGAVGEVGGAIAVVVSLVYLAIQVRSQVSESRIASVHEITAAFRSAITSSQDPQRAELYARAVKAFDELSEAERIQFISMAQGLLRVWEEAYYQHEAGRLDQRIWKALAQYTDIISAQGFQRVWELRRHTYSDEFRVFVDTRSGGEYRFQ